MRRHDRYVIGLYKRGLIIILVSLTLTYRAWKRQGATV